jgi:hypothetical protein
MKSAGCTLNQRYARRAPTIAAQKTTSHGNGGSREAVEAVREVHAVGHRDDREYREHDEENRTDDHLADHGNVDTRDVEVPLDVQRCRDGDDRLPYELVTSADPKPVDDVHVVIDETEDADRDQRADRDDGLRQIVVAQVWR